MAAAITWISRADAHAWEDDARLILAAALRDELEVLDMLVELFVPSGLTIPAALNSAQVVAVLGIESSLYQDLRAFRHLVALGYAPEALQIARGIYLALGKGRAAVTDPAFASRIANDEHISDLDVRRAFAHARAGSERPGDWDHEAEVLAEIDDEYLSISRILHKRKGGSEFQVRRDAAGGATIFRDPPGVLVEGYGAAVVLKIAVEVANGLRVMVPFLLDLGDVDHAPWNARWSNVVSTINELMERKWKDE